MFDELLLDVADYRHVHEGPGVVLIGHQANYSVDNTDNRLGVRYNRKAPLDGTNQDRLTQATRAALTAFQRLEAESGLKGKLRFGGQGNRGVYQRPSAGAESTPRRAKPSSPSFKPFLRSCFGIASTRCRMEATREACSRVNVKANREFSLADLLANLSS